MHASSQGRDDKMHITERVRYARACLILAVMAALVVVAMTMWTALVETKNSLPVPAAVAAVVLVVGPPVLLVKAEKLDPSRGRPARWLPRGFCTAAPVSVGAGISVSSQGVVVGFVATMACVIALIVPVAFGSHLLRHPLSVDLATSDIEVYLKIRPNRPLQLRLLANDDLVLDGREMCLTLRPNLSWKVRHCIPLQSVAEVSVRPTFDKEPVWYTFDDGRCYRAPAGCEVVVIRQRGGVKLEVPVFDARAFADVLEVRIRRARGDLG